ncbi:MAG: hypothetical protein ACI4AM_04120, partial [Muribaculaceae bacterium]
MGGVICKKIFTFATESVIVALLGKHFKLNPLSTEIIFMAKTLKFNLKIDKDIQVRTLEDLRNNFVLEDILEYYKSKKLHKWLRARGFEKELKEVDKITGTS